MSFRVTSILLIVAVAVLVASVFFPYGKFNVATKYAKTIQVAVCVLVVGIAIRYALFSF